jgi:hypothetical protein
MNVRFVVALILATLALSILAATQSANLSGTWALEAQAASGPDYQLGALSGTLTLEVKDSVVTARGRGRCPSRGN